MADMYREYSHQYINRKWAGDRPFTRGGGSGGQHYIYWVAQKVLNIRMRYAASY